MYFKILLLLCFYTIKTDVFHNIIIIMLLSVQINAILWGINYSHYSQEPCHLWIFYHSVRLFLFKGSNKNITTVLK